MRLAVAVPALDHVSALFAHDLARMYAETCASVPVTTLAMMVGMPTHQAREKLLHDVMSLWGATHVLWLDADMTFPPDTALRLLAHDRDVVAANYVTRRGQPRPTAFRDSRCIPSHGRSGLEKVDHVGMGVFLMKTSAVASCPRPCFCYTGPDGTEDVYFCRLLRNAGHAIHIDHDLSQSVGHVGQHLYREASAVVSVQAH